MALKRKMQLSTAQNSLQRSTGTTMGMICNLVSFISSCRRSARSENSICSLAGGSGTTPFCGAFCCCCYYYYYYCCTYIHFLSPHPTPPSASGMKDAFSFSYRSKTRRHTGSDGRGKARAVSFRSWANDTGTAST